ncbi:MAG: S-layer homology domain-containing protein [Clostridia bacterium]|nr:S-layer homology domain-containing protein [Clostridia bacterium]
MKRVISIVLTIAMLALVMPMSIANALADVEPMVYSGRLDYAIKNDGSLWLLDTHSERVNDENKWVTTGEKICEDVVSVSECWDYLFILKKDSSLWYSKFTEGGNYSHETGFKKYMDGVKDFCATSAGAGGNKVYVIKTDGTLIAWAFNGRGQIVNFFDGRTKEQDVRTIATDVKEVSADGISLLFIKEDNTLWAWGWSSVPGNDVPKREETPVKIADYAKSACVRGIYGYIDENDTLWAWGDTTSLHKGPGSRETRYTPVRVMDNVKYYYSSMVVAEDGSLWDIEDDYTVTCVTGISDVEKADADFVIRDDMSLWCYHTTGYHTGEYDWVMQLCGFVIKGEKEIVKDTETVLEAIYYDEAGNAIKDGNVSWSIDDTSVAEIIPWGNNLTVKGLKPGKTTVRATHNPTGSQTSFEIEVVSYTSTLYDTYNFLTDSRRTLDHKIFLGIDNLSDKVDIVWSSSDNSVAQVISDTKGSVRILEIDCKKEGECVLTAKIDGYEVKQIKINVLGSVYDTVERESVLRARVLANNMMYDYYTNLYTSLPRTFTEDMNLGLIQAYDFLDKIFKKGINFTYYYEIVLMDILTGNSYEESAGKYSALMSDKMQQHVAMQVAAIADDGVDAINPYAAIAEDMTDITDSDLLKFGDVLDAAFLANDIKDGAVDASSGLASLGLVTNAEIDAIRMIKSSTDNKHLKSACDNIIKRHSDIMNNNADAMCEELVDGGLAPAKEFAMDTLMGAVLEAAGFGAVGIGTGVGKAVNNVMLNVDDITAQSLILSAYVEIEDAMKKGIDTAQSQFEATPNLETASKFMTMADIHKSVLVNGCDRTMEYIDIVKQGDSNVDKYFWGNFDPNSSLGLFESKTDFDGARKMVAHTKSVIDKADFFSVEGLDIAEFISTVKSTESSDWAKPEIDKAKALKILPSNLEFNYKENITRAEFCTLLTQLLTQKTGRDIKTLVKEKGVQVKSPFDDTYYEYVDYIYKLGIVNGMGDDKFDPLSEITREQAATMLCRTAEVLGFNTQNEQSVPSDISDWAKSGVGFVMEKGIMNGTGDGFEPRGTYTKEQAIATFVRMYDKLK